MKLTIYDKTGNTAKCKAKKAEYNGEFMGMCNITCTIESPVPVDFAIGDYVDYRGERFYMNYDPSVVKKSSKLSIGNAFVYENVVFNSPSDELTRCDFLDYVKGDNKVHFSSLPNFMFFAASVKDLADRLQANLDRVYHGEQKWTVDVHPECGGEKNISVSINRLKIWDALALANSTFKVNFIIRGRHITIGTAGVAANKVFKYGKGNGLKELEKSSDSEQAVITRLRVYGSSRNLPPRYYNKIGRHYFLTVVRGAIISDKLPIVSFYVNLGDVFKKDYFTDLRQHATAIEEFYQYWIHVDVAGENVRASLECRPDKSEAFVTINNETCNDIEAVRRVAAALSESLPKEIKVTKGVNLDKAPASNVWNPSYMADNMAVNFLMLPGFPETTLDPYIDSKNIESLGIREGSVFFDGSDGNEDIYPSLEGMTAKQLIDSGVFVSVDEGDNGNLDEVADAEQTTDDGMWNNLKEGDEIPTFTIKLKDIGFDINEYLSTETATISMKDGMCGGRDFEIVGGKNKPKKEGNKWIITCNRVKDDSLNLYFPYKDYNIKKGDKFVLLGINMPDVYIKSASQKLLEAGKKYLSKNDYVRSVYSPKVDDIEMAREHELSHSNNQQSIYDTIKEGDLMIFEDSDLNISGNVIIDNLTIVEEAGKIPHYEITLRDEKSVGTIEKIQQQIDSMISGNGVGGGLNTEQVKSLIKLIGNTNYLSKVRPDSTPYLLKLLGGAEVGEAIKSFIAGKGTILDSHGLIQTDRLEVRNSLKVLELIINRLQGMENDFVFSPTRKVNKVEKVDATTYKLFLDPKMDGDLIPFREGNILYSIVNDLLTGGNSYYTSYMRVLTTNQNEYSMTIVLYPDAEVPGGKNYLPAEGYNVSRRGDVHLPQDWQSNPDSQSWYISSSEGRLLFLQNVIKPVLEDYNYALSVGKFPNIKALDKLPISKDEVGIMAQTIVVENLYQYDYNGDVMARKVNRGAWAREVAVSDKPYRNVQHETNKPTGTEYTLLEQHTVYHLGCLWGCLTDKTQEEPKWNAQGWQLLEGNSELAVSIASDNGDDFYCGEVNTNLDVRVYYGHNDITEDVLAHPGAGMEWFRDTGDAPADNLWKPNYVDGNKLKVHIDNSNQHGVGSKFGFETKRVVFTCDVFVPMDGGVEKLTATYGLVM